MTRRDLVFYTPAAALLAITSACDIPHGDVSTGPMRDEPISIDQNKAERANIEFDMGAGEMRLRGGASKLLDGRFEYNVAEWKPRVTTSDTGTHATVTISQPEHVGLRGHARYVWDLALNDKVQMDLTLKCGAGQALLNIGDLDLRSLSVHMGAGKVDLDLRGHPSRDYEVNIEGGVGQATVRLPEGVGIRAEAHGGLGSINVTGLEKKGDHYENSLYDNSKVNVRIRVNGGIGEIQLLG